MTASEPKLANQQNAYKFLLNNFHSQKRFTREDFKAATGWTESSFNTYWTKQFKPFLVETTSGWFRVGESFRAYCDWPDFRRHLTQVRSSSSYTHHTYGTVLNFEFFLPLTNETQLRMTLDALFFQDTIVQRLRACEPSELQAWIPMEQSESGDAYIQRVARWLSCFFGGYSISHVNGRFRNGALLSLEEAASHQKQGKRYLIDETTAVTRFIIPCDSEEEASSVRWFFERLFVQGIIQTVNGEAEIWMLESGLHDVLHVWRVT